jgi:hypothetical protein
MADHEFLTLLEASQGGEPVKQKGPPASPLPNKQAKGGELYAPELMESYRARFGLSEGDMRIRPVRYLVKAKIDTDVYVKLLGKKIAALEAQVGALLQFVETHAAKKVVNV